LEHECLPLSKLALTLPVPLELLELLLEAAAGAELELVEGVGAGVEEVVGAT